MSARIAAGLCAGLSLAAAQAASVDTETLTLYQGGAALVTGSATLTGGPGEQILDGLPPRLRFESLTVTGADGAGVASLHRRPETDLLADRVGKTVTLVDGDGQTREGRLVQVRGDGRFLVAVDEHIEVIAPGDPWRLVLPADEAAPGEGVTATLTDGTTSGTGVELSYLTDGLDWQADYTLRLTGDGATLAGAATLANDTGAAFDAASVLLVAGDVNDAGGGARPMQREMAMAASDAAPERETAGDWHAYRLDGHHALGDGEHLRLPLMPAREVAVDRRYEATGHANAWHGRGQQPMPVTIRLAVAPDGERRPLPAGTVRVIDETRSPAFFQGSDRIGHTPAGEGFDLVLGRAFDVRAEREQTAFERLGGDWQEAAWTIRLSNAGNEAVTVDVIERVAGDWELVEASQAPADRDAQGLEWAVTVPAEGEATLSYRVRVAR